MHEDRGQDDRQRRTRQDSESLHGEHRRDERPSCLLVRVLRHDCGGQWVVAADPEAEPEPEEAPVKQPHHD